MGLSYSIKRSVFRFLGDIKFFGLTHPFWFQINAHGYKLQGEHYRQIKQVIQPGDVLIRRFEQYLSSYLIPGFWTHAGLYIGDDGDKPEQVVHAVSEGVLQEDILNFLRTDHLLILRPHTGQEKAVPLAKAIVGRPYDFGFDFKDTHRFSCTELVSYCYPGLASGTKRFGQEVIIGDDFEKSANAAKVWDSRDHVLPPVIEILQAKR